jgi:hypothetical protein
VRPGDQTRIERAQELALKLEPGGSRPPDPPGADALALVGQESALGWPLTILGSQEAGPGVSPVR